MEKPLFCTIKNTAVLNVDEQKSSFQSGCRIIDVTFPNIIQPEVGEIRFKNYYVAYLTVKAKYRNTETRDTGDSKWKTPIRRMKLMPNPHCETGSQDYFSITRKHFRTHLVNITAVRLILQQPSPVCKDFKLEDLKLFHSNENWKTPGLPGWLTDDPLEGKNEKQSIEGLPSLDTISAGLQNMWALSENISTQPIGTTFGRFDVDGCYDINLLSYT